MTSKSIVYDEAEIVKCYEKNESARIVAEAFGISDETVRRVLIRNGISRTHRHDNDRNKTELTSNCKTKYCPALIVMLVTVIGMSHREVQSIINAKHVSIVGSVISRKGLQKKPTYSADLDMDEIEREYLAGATTYELGIKYGVHHATISKWMRQRGHARCNEKRTCETCGLEFTAHTHNAKYCSKKCYYKSLQSSHSHAGSSTRRARRRGAVIEYGITLKRLYERDNGICAICGGVCDWNDIHNGVVGAMYPTRDHIIPLAKGGSHTWDNVQLAHKYCNSVKRDKIGYKPQAKVIT